MERQALTVRTNELISIRTGNRTPVPAMKARYPSLWTIRIDKYTHTKNRTWVSSVRTMCHAIKPCGQTIHLVRQSNPLWKPDVIPTRGIEPRLIRWERIVLPLNEVGVYGAHARNRTLSSAFKVQRHHPIDHTGCNEFGTGLEPVRIIHPIDFESIPMATMETKPHTRDRNRTCFCVALTSTCFTLKLHGLISCASNGIRTHARRCRSAT